MINLIIAGYKGRMGSRILELARGLEDMRVVGTCEAGEPLDPKALKNADCVIDFTTPEATVNLLKLAVQHKTAMVIGTTGINEEGIKQIREAAKKIPIVFSPNMAYGVNVVFETAAELAEKLGSDYKVEIVETHHIHKKDAPSGTAKRLAEAIAKARGVDVSAIPIKSRRIGEVVGDHTVVFRGPSERIELFHHADSRDVFALGALKAARFAAKQKPGLYSMKDVIKK